jgi:hypothetical protein
MVDQAITRLNRGDVSAFADFWDENADYVGVDGKLTRGRSQIQGLFRQMGKKQRRATKRNNRTDSLCHTGTCDCGRLVDFYGSSGHRRKGVTRNKSRGFELLQKKNGSWKFIATRENGDLWGALTFLALP